MRHPRYWPQYEKYLQQDYQLASIFMRWQKGGAIDEADFLVMRDKALEIGISLLPGPRWLIWDLLDHDLKQLHSDFCTYYSLSSEPVAWALQSAFNLAWTTATSEFIHGTANLGGSWERHLVDITRASLWGMLQLKYLDLSQQNDREFRQCFEQEWEQLMPYRGLYFDFRVIPKISWDDLVRYQRLPRGDLTIRSMISCYMTHQILECPHLMKVATTNFTELAFMRRLRSMYEPLINRTVQRAVRNLELTPGQIEEKEDIRTAALQYFEDSFAHFQFSWRPKQQKNPFGQRGILGLTEDKAKREQIDAVLKEKGIGYSTQDMAVYAFANYMETRLRHWVNKNFPADPLAAPTLSLNTPVGGAGGVDVDGGEWLDSITEGASSRAGHSLPWPLDSNAYIEETPDVTGPDGTMYMMIRQAARRYGLSEDQLRRMDKTGSFPAARAGEVLGGISPLPANTRLYPRSPEADHAAEVAIQRARSHSSQLTGQELNRKAAAKFLGVREHLLRTLEETGKIQPTKKGKSLVYDEAVLAQAQAFIEQRQARVEQKRWAKKN